MENGRRSLRLYLTAFSVCLLFGCATERPTQLRLEGNAIPVFALSGSGQLSSFSVYTVPPIPEKMDKPFSQQVPAWQIVAHPDYLRGRPVEEIQKLSYGSIPQGYKQSYPENGVPAPPIQAERFYFFDCNTTNAPQASGFFVVHDGRTISAKVKTPCWTTRNGKWVSVPCIEQQ
ncbi:MAG: hypothetical protein WB994_22865 [Candidatus Acidiferrum sp.]